MSRLIRAARAALLVALIAPSASFADTDTGKFPGQPYATLALPRGWHAGGEVELEISGKGLFAPKDLLFYRKGIEVVSVEPLGDRPMDSRDRYNHRRKLLDKLRKETKNSSAQLEEPIDYPRVPVSPGTRVRAKLRIAKDASYGEYPFRVVARGGMGSVMTFWVGKLPTKDEAEPYDSAGENDSREDAEALTPGHTVNGFIARYDTDVYKIQAKKGQRLTFEIEAARLATYDRGGYLDVELKVSDASGKQVAFADDSALYIEDPFLSVTAPADGELFVEIKETVPTYNSYALPYRLHVVKGTRPAMVYPAGGRPGEKLTVQTIEPGQKAASRQVTVPGGAAPGTVGVFADPASPSPNPFRAFPAANTLEREPNNSPDKATAASGAAPIAFNGILSQTGDVDVFRFRAEKGRRYRVQLFSSALGTALDARMWIASVDKPDKRRRVEDCGADELDRVMVSNHRDMLDPATIFVPEADGEYLVGVEDSRGGGDPTFVYRIEISETSPSVLAYLGALRDNEHRRRNRVQVPPGGRYSTVIALRDGFGSEVEGELELVAEGLPAGVTMKTSGFDSANSRLPVVFEAAPGAKPSAKLVELYVRPKGGGARLPGGFRNTVGSNGAGGNAYLYYIYLDKLAVAVTEEAPFRIEVARPKAGATQDGELGLKVKVVRKPGFEGPVEIATDWLPPNSGRSASLIIDPDETEGEYIISARRNTPPEEYQLALTAQTRVGDRRTGDGMYFASSNFVPIRVQEPYLSARVGRAAVEIGKTGELVATLTHIKEFKGKATARLGRLPAGVELVGGPVTIKPGQEELKFKLKATESALTGTFKGVFCDLEFEENGQTVSQRSGYGTIRIDTPRGGKPVAKK